MRKLRLDTSFQLDIICYNWTHFVATEHTLLQWTSNPSSRRLQQRAQIRRSGGWFKVSKVSILAHLVQILHAHAHTREAPYKFNLEQRLNDAVTSTASGEHRTFYFHLSTRSLAKRMACTHRILIKAHIRQALCSLRGSHRHHSHDNVDVAYEFWYCDDSNETLVVFVKLLQF